MKRLLWWLICAAVVVSVLRMLLPWLLIGAVIFGGIYLLARQAERRGQREAGLRERADRQHTQVLAGDPAGVYGQYPPADQPRSEADSNFDSVRLGVTPNWRRRQELGAQPCGPCREVELARRRDHHDALRIAR